MANTIFVQIASYRDPELLNTLDDLFDKADKPGNLHVCIAWQHDTKDTWDTLERYKDNKSVTIIDIPHTDSKGACWARHQIQQQYKGEKFTLQLDSHHRFVKGWDTSSIKMLKDLQKKGHKKPLLTSYIPSYNPKNDPDGRVNTPWGMSFDRFTPEGVIFFLPYYMEVDTKQPLPARFYSAHFAFTIGEFATEVQHDPEYYFHGEEISIAVRAFTHGYDLFHPNKVLAWHEYTREGRTKQWDDDKEWGKRNTDCHAKMRSLLGVDSENEIIELEYGLGSERTIQDYETYAGIKFSDRSLTARCRTNDTPPGTVFEPFFQEFKHAIDLHHSQFPLDDYTFCAFIFEDKDGKSLYREDMEGDHFNKMVKNNKEGAAFTVWKKYSGPKPHNIIIWPHSEKNGWSDKKIITL